MKTRLIALVAGASLVGSAAAATTSGSITGIYTTVVKGTVPAQLRGDWAIRFTKTGEYELAKRAGNSGQVMVIGHAKIAGGRITFQNETGPAACKGSQAVGRYGWKLTGATLRFTRYSDTCLGRRTILGGKFTKVG